MVLALFAAAAVAVPVITEPIRTDGRLDEPVWETAARIDGFLARRPVEGAAPSQQTTALVLRDDRRLYIGFRSQDLEPGKIRASFSDRDATFSDDLVGVAIDPWAEGRRGFLFLVSPFGVQTDCVVVEGGFDDDCTWDAVFDSAGRLTENGYEVELSIPFASIRYDPARDEWGFAVMRMIARAGEQVTWPPYQAALGHPLKQFGRISGMRGIPVRGTSEWIPELTTRSGPSVEKGSGLAGAGTSPDRSELDLGLTGRVSKGGAALDFTLNPDFSQIESDPARIAANQRFALYFDERRPFFLEGRELLRTPWDAVYTRTIVDPLYGVKVSGKTGPTAFTILHALDESPADSIVDDRWNEDAYRKQPAIATIARAATELSPALQVGVLATDKHVANAWNRVAGVDANIRFRERYLIATQVMGAATDHPDGAYTTGTVAKVRLFRDDRYWNWFSWYEQVDPGFRAELGFIPRTDYREAGADTGYRFETGRKTLNGIRPQLNVRWLDGMNVDDAERVAMGRLAFQFPTGSAVPIYRVARERYRGKWFDKRGAIFAVGQAPTKWLSFFTEIGTGTEIAYFADETEPPYLGGNVTGGVEATVRPFDRLSIQASVSRDVFSDTRESDAQAQFFGRRGEDIAYDVTVGRLSTQLFLSQALSLRLIADYDDSADEVAASLLFSYRPGPGTVVYLGYQDALENGPDADVKEDRAVFLKLSYLWRT